MKRLVNLLIIALFLTALGLGAYEIGTRVDTESRTLAAQDSELNQVSTTTSSKSSHRPSTRTVYFVVGGLAIGVGAIAVASLISSMSKARRRQRWRAT